MDQLFEILGKPVDSPESRAALDEFELTRWDTGADGDEEDDVSLVDPAQGIEVQHTPDGVIQSIFLFSHGHQGFARFSRSLSRNLTFQSTRADVREQFGEPDLSGAPTTGTLLGDSGPWDRYTLPGGYIHFQFRFDRDAIQLVTLMTLDAVETT